MLNCGHTHTCTDGYSTGLFTTDDDASKNQKEILETMAIAFNCDYRENVLESGVYGYVKKCVRTNGHTKEGLYYSHNFCLNTNPLEYQINVAIHHLKDILLLLVRDYHTIIHYHHREKADDDGS